MKWCDEKKKRLYCLVSWNHDSLVEKNTRKNTWLVDVTEHDTSGSFQQWFTYGMIKVNNIERLWVNTSFLFQQKRIFYIRARILLAHIFEFVKKKRRSLFLSLIRRHWIWNVKKGRLREGFLITRWPSLKGWHYPCTHGNRILILLRKVSVVQKSEFNMIRAVEIAIGLRNSPGQKGWRKWGSRPFT